MKLLSPPRKAPGRAKRSVEPVTFETVMVGGELRVVGAALALDELEALERAWDAGDVRAEATLKLLREGRPERRTR